ncbi:hypothetical protein KAH27_02915 [bacterium]|nr:hypothetical protein [bacterium]
MIVVDDRERPSGICDELAKLQLPFEVKRLDIGDYIINDTIFIERKTTADFIESLQDKRLYRQVVRMRKDGKRALMIIEGARMPGWPIIKGALCSISAKHYMPILRSVDLKGTAWIFNHLHNYNSDKYSEQPFCSHDFRAKRGVASMQERMLMQLYRVGPSLAKKLLSQFGSVGGIMRADEKDLLKIKGVGKMLLQEIRILRGE